MQQDQLWYNMIYFFYFFVFPQDDILWDKLRENFKEISKRKSPCPFMMLDELEARLCNIMHKRFLAKRSLPAQRHDLE